ncbi:hypothetical protein A3E49_02220 [Candidatus Saccharibacteria bacterium RIFCSPHIGHO2_12_FULL_49_19]|nr:MAG: hypothetical protein A2708_01330 [Candidatus Saccharibacteria bacterium RIFCSPHIGHO2_01_FULL_49_21]OGL36831.1 MAG: hypothetical protein A3E49_02220 [Candidatus Saccharibacteria bacterium RIFCSPHIGHO2_12_FULL_49_19]OGL37147.1 MAG: hypothetical protein A3B63_00895 [Candidatus Saccharibacteria bacterium RIFCSPLOWO2_01_FULL_49_22]
MAEEVKIRIRHEEPPRKHETNHVAEQHAGHAELNQRREYNRKLVEARVKAAEQAISAREVTVGEEDKPYQPKEAFVNKELKDMAYARTLSRVRKQMGPLNRLTSKVVHQPVVNAVSEATAKTIGRPSGILGGATAALAGSLVYYWLTKHYGYEYSYSVFVVLLAAGFIAGWVFEAFYRLLRAGK